MAKDADQFAFSSEQECMTTVNGVHDAMRVGEAMNGLARKLAGLAPSLPGGAGIFNGYGRIYMDCGHVELAMIECDDPYHLALVVETQQRLAARAAAALAQSGLPLTLANNNHSGLLQPRAPIWGAHENYLVQEHPRTTAGVMLPFLTTRLYAGSGGVQSPTGNFLAGVRHQFMQLAEGGGTTGDRAIHSTAREEHLMGPHPHRFRYHLLLADGHRSQFNTALQFGATALTLHAIRFDRSIAARLNRIPSLPHRGSWVQTIRRLNLLARPGEPPAASPRAIQVQRIYLDAARRCAESLEPPPPWAPRLLRDWEETLDALDAGNRPWLAARLDAFAKYELFSAYLRDAGASWEELPQRRDLFYELALLDQSYHDFTSDDSLFQRIENAGLLQHRVGGPIPAGSEEDPYVPATRTRARARARFIRDHADQKNLVIDWAWVHDRETGRWRTLFDPFAESFSPWAPSRIRSEMRPPPGRETPQAVAELLERIRATRSRGVESEDIPF